MFWIIIGILFCFLAIGTVQSKQDTGNQLTEELINAMLSPEAQAARNAGKLRARREKFMSRVLTVAIVTALVWYTFFYTPAHAQPYPTYTTEQLCAYVPEGPGVMEYARRMCIGKNQNALDVLRMDWYRVSATTRQRCLDEQASIVRNATQNFQLVTADAYWRLADCIYRWGIHEMMPTQVR